MNILKKILVAISLFSILFAQAKTASANHSWAGYHWARSANPFNLKLGDNLTANWKNYLAVASTDWSISSVLDTTIVTGQAGSNCKATTGRIEVCNKTYGKNGWLGIAQIYLSGTHITKGITKLNDTYFNTTTYNTPAWKQLVMCQEVGHNFGLDHQDENFNNSPLNTCMDYTSDPTPNQHPNSHDYEELSLIYSHLDSFTTISQSLATLSQSRLPEGSDDPSSWGKIVKQSPRSAVFEKDFGNGQKMLTHVFYAE